MLCYQYKISFCTVIQSPLDNDFFLFHFCPVSGSKEEKGGPEMVFQSFLRLCVFWLHERLKSFTSNSISASRKDLAMAYNGHYLAFAGNLQNPGPLLLVLADGSHTHTNTHIASMRSPSFS